MPFTNLFVYNELKLGRKYNRILTQDGGIFVGVCRVDGYGLYRIGGELAAAIQERNRSVFGELWIANEQLLGRLDRMENLDMGGFVRQYVLMCPLASMFVSRDPFLAMMYTWVHGKKSNDVLCVSGVL